MRIIRTLYLIYDEIKIVKPRDDFSQQVFRNLHIHIYLVMHLLRRFITTDIDIVSDSWPSLSRYAEIDLLRKSRAHVKRRGVVQTMLIRIICGTYEMYKLSPECTNFLELARYVDDESNYIRNLHFRSLREFHTFVCIC